MSSDWATATGRMINNQQRPPLASHCLDDGPEFSLVRGQRPVQDLPARPVDGDRVVVALADADEEVDVLMVLDHRKPPRIRILQFCWNVQA